MRLWNRRERQVRANIPSERTTLVARFAPHMGRELEANAWKGDDWLTAMPLTLAYELLYHAAKAVRAAEERPDDVLELAADVANCAAMLADKVVDLSQAPDPLPEGDDRYVKPAGGGVDLRQWAHEVTEILAAGNTPVTTHREAIFPQPKQHAPVIPMHPDDIPF